MVSLKFSIPLAAVVLFAGLGASLSQAQTIRLPGKPPSPKIFKMSTRTIQMPLRLDAALIPKLKEICLYVREASGDWVCRARVGPTASHITCELPLDGEYGLTIVTIDQMGNPSPADLTIGPPGVIVVVDTRQNNTEPPAKTNNVIMEPETLPLGNRPVVPPNAVAQELGTLPPAVAPMGPELVTPLASPPAFPKNSAPAQEPKASAAREPASLPMRQYLNSTRVGLDYTVKKVGPSGVGKIDVYVMSEKGGGWKRLTTVDDPRNHSEIDLPGEGVFGIRLVATNGNGLGAKTPGAGDLPTALFEIDLTRPTVTVDIDPATKNGTIDIHYKVSDKNLGPDAIQILYAVKPDGPWQTVATKLKNEGIFRWGLPRDVPARFLIRVEARDLAGNIARVDAPNPVPLDLTEPDVNLVGLTPVPVQPATPGNGR